jgi:membrane-bound lytic murein transglycosylase D
VSSPASPLARRRHVVVSLAATLLVGANACAGGLRPLPGPQPVAVVTHADGGETARDSVTPPASRTRATPPVRRASRDSAPSHAHAAGVSFDLPVHDFESDERVRRYVSLYSGADREDFTAQLERGTRYEAMIRAKLRAAGVPEDMRYLALIESGYDQNAVSRSSAVGMWQFMAGTAREVGLRVDWWVDERRDPVRATDAAARNLRWLRSQFGSMFLAAAAYNGGETRVARGLAQLASADSVRATEARLDSLALGVSSDDGASDAPDASEAPLVRPAVAVRPSVPVAEDATAVAPPPRADGPSAADARFFDLASADYIRAETKNYVPKLIAAMLIAKEPARYGITVRPQAAFAYDSVRVAPLTPLAAVASAADVSRQQLLELNPHLLRGLTPPGAPMMLRVPVGRGEDAARALADLPASERRAFRRVTTTKRETLDGLADRAGVPLSLLRRYNPSLTTVSSGKWKGRLVGGQAVRVPTRAVLDLARDLPDLDSAPLAGLPMPAAAKSDSVKATASKTKESATSKASESSPRRSADVARAKAAKAAESARSHAPNTKTAAARDAAKAAAARAAEKAAARKPAAKKSTKKKG